MKRSSPSPILLLFQYANPWLLLAGIVFYTLGGGVVLFLGGAIDWVNFWLGLVMLLILMASSFYLKSYYDTFETNPQLHLPPRLRLLRKDEEAAAGLPRALFLQVSITTLTVGAVLTVLLFQRGALNPPAFILLGIAFLLAFFYAVPPLRLVNTGYGELTQALLIVNLFPALSYLFQTGELHRLLAMLTFPITALFLAMQLAFGLPDYASDLKSGRKSLMLRLGWQQGMNLHNILILSSYIMIGLAAILGLPWALTWPGLLTLPFGIFQIYQMTLISNGAKPRWRLLLLTAMATMGLMTYMITLALWTG